MTHLNPGDVTVLLSYFSESNTSLNFHVFQRFPCLARINVDHMESIQQRVNYLIFFQCTEAAS